MKIWVIHRDIIQTGQNETTQMINNPLADEWRNKMRNISIQWDIIQQ